MMMVTIIIGAITIVIVIVVVIIVLKKMSGSPPLTRAFFANCGVSIFPRPSHHHHNQQSHHHKENITELGKSGMEWNFYHEILCNIKKYHVLPQYCTAPHTVQYHAKQQMQYHEKKVFIKSSVFTPVTGLHFGPQGQNCPFWLINGKN